MPPFFSIRDIHSFYISPSINLLFFIYSYLSLKLCLQLLVQTKQIRDLTLVYQPFYNTMLRNTNGILRNLLFTYLSCNGIILLTIAINFKLIKIKVFVMKIITYALPVRLHEKIINMIKHYQQDYNLTTPLFLQNKTSSKINISEYTPYIIIVELNLLSYFFSRNSNKLSFADGIICINENNQSQIQETNYGIDIKYITDHYSDFKNVLNHFMIKTSLGATSFIEKTKDCVSLIHIKSIDYIETYERHTLIHCENNNILSYKTLKAHMHSLKRYVFFQCHASYIVNLERVAHVHHSDLETRAGNIIPISKHRYVELINLMNEHFTPY